MRLMPGRTFRRVLNLAAVERVKKRSLVDVGAAGGVDDDDAVLHLGDVLPVDDVHADPLPECRLALCFCTDSHRVGQPMQMIPLVDFRRPCISCDTQRSDDQHLANQKTVEAKVEDGGKRDDALTKTHVEEYSGDWVLQDEVRGIRLVVMRLVFH